MTKMTISKRGLDLIKEYESLRLTAYVCPAGKLTIGYGHTSGVTKAMKITQQQAEEFLLQDVAPIEKKLNNLGINFTQNQFDALCSWCFNLGLGDFTHSTMLIRIQTNASDLEITDQLVKWVNSCGKPLLGLKRRRVSEANMFLGKEAYYLDGNDNIKRR